MIINHFWFPIQFPSVLHLVEMLLKLNFLRVIIFPDKIHILPHRPRDENTDAQNRYDKVNRDRSWPEASEIFRNRRSGHDQFRPGVRGPMKTVSTVSTRLPLA